MKADIHPAVYDAKVTCASCGNTWTTTSTKKELRIDVCSKCHPFFTGESAKILDVEGQVDRFYKKLSVSHTYLEQQKAKEKSMNSVERSIDDLGLTPRAVTALKAAGILTIGQVMDKLAEGEEALLAISGYGQSALTATKKKLRALGFELSQAPDKAEKPAREAEAAEASE